MSKTLSDLKTEAFGILTGEDAFNSPAPEELDAIAVYVEPLLSQLSKDNIVYIADSDDIPDEYFLPIARLLANVAGPRFGSAMNEQAKQIDEAALRRLTAGSPTYETLRAEYF